jgi:acyl-coenzyme A synthetase/AMP-(fatty) acid ligase
MFVYLQIPNLISFWMYEVSPSVLESRLLAHHSVVDAAVVGIPDKELPSHQTIFNWHFPEKQI